MLLIKKIFALAIGITSLTVIIGYGTQKFSYHYNQKLRLQKAEEIIKSIPEVDINGGSL